MKLPNDQIVHYESENGVSIDITYTELVRCKDCKYAMALVNGASAILCKKQDWATVWNINDYCSYGEQKGGD